MDFSNIGHWATLIYARVNLNPMPELTLSPQSGTLDLASADSFQIFKEDVSVALSLACLLYDPDTALEHRSFSLASK
jgi:hypothetical protein